MKCPHCGMNLRDDITECGYCGGKISRRKGKAAAGEEMFTIPRGGIAAKGAASSKKPSEEPDEQEEEEEGGLSAILQPGEQVLIGALNVSVKKFSFHAYLTNQRIFLIDTQEKKLKVTAKDVARDTITGSNVELSENSDPVLVLSIKSGEDEVKTMKLVFTQSGTDRSGEIDEWIALLHEGEEPVKKPAKKAPAPARKPRVEEPVEEEAEEAEEEEEPLPHIPERARPRSVLEPEKRPVKKDHEKQPPVKRPLSPYKVPEAEEEPEPAAPQRKTHVRQIVASSYDREIPARREPEEVPVKKPEVQTAMKVAMKDALKQTAPVASRPQRKAIVEVPRHMAAESEPEEFAPARRPAVQEDIHERAGPEHAADSPQFCHNCGKKLPHSANFCPGCGTKLSTGRTLPHSRTTSPHAAKKTTTRTDPPGHAMRPVIQEEIEDDDTDLEKPVPTRPPVKKAPKGSEMTILHKFLRR